MVITKTYFCGICKTIPDQVSHHKSHIETQKHTDKYELFELKLGKLTEDELVKKYKTKNIKDICNELETIMYTTNINKNDTNLKETIDPFEDTIESVMSENKDNDKNNTISNKEALKDKIHDIHNFLRNNGAGYGMNALKVFNILFGLKKIEEKCLIDKVELKRPECEFSYLLKLANENNDTSNEKLASTIFKEVIDGINDSKITDLLFYEIPKNIKGKVFSYLIKEIDNITKIETDCNVLLSGKIYEYFIGRDESAISELGAYFTDRHIVDYILKKLDPNITENGLVPSMIDMFGGSGGFTTGYINFLQEKYDNIDWSKGINKIHHYDMNEDVIKSAGLEIFCLTGELPNMNNLKYKNSFTDDFDNKKYVYPITNPPYGGDKNKKSVLQEKNDKIKEYIKKDLLTITDEGILIARQKQLKAIEAFEKSEKKESDKSRVSVANCSHRINKFAIDNNLTGNDKESCSLMLLMDIVKVGGTAIGVLKEGVFFNKTYKNIRKCLIENYNVREVISVPSDQFENTTTKTSILIFDNTEKKTEEVKFSDLTVERYQNDVFVEMNGLIVITETKNDISGVSDKLISIASKDDILSNLICSLNGKDYNKKVIVCGEGYELVRLGDICENQNGNAFKTNEYVNSGIPLITITHIKNEMIIFNNNHYINENEKYSKFEIKNLDIVITLTGKKPNLCSIGIKHGGKKQYLNQRCAILRNFKKINHYYFMAMFNSYLSQYINSYIGNGSNQDNISLNEILNLQIPIPKSEDKILEWVNKISKPYDDKTSKQNKIKDLEEFIQNKIKDITDNEDCEEVELGNICEVQDGYEFKDTDLNTDVNNVPLIRATYITNKTITNYIKKDSKFDKYIVKKGDIIFSQVGNVGSMCKYLENRIGYNKRNAFRLKEINFNQDYLYYYLLSDDFKNKIFSNGSIVKFIKIPELRSIKIKIPKNKQLIEDLLTPTFNEIEKLNDDLKESEELYKHLIKELSEEAIPTVSTLISDVENINIKEEETTSSTSSIKSLQEQCKSLGIKGYSKYKKKEDKDNLIKLIEEHS